MSMVMVMLLIVIFIMMAVVDGFILRILGGVGVHFMTLKVAFMPAEPGWLGLRAKAEG